MQIFSHNPRQWKQTVIPKEEIERFICLREEHDIRPVFIHASYLINLASRSREVLGKSIDLLSYELQCADALGVEYVVLHTGSARGDDENEARKRAVGSLARAVSGGKYHTSILLENTAGERGDITSSVRALAAIIDACHCGGMGGICIDTCHAFTSGYQLTSPAGLEKLVAEIDTYIGLKNLRLIHFNDSKKPFNSGVDRHEHIGEGYIGLNGFRNFLSDKRIATVPLILETPKRTDEDDRRNMRTVYKMLSGRVRN